MGDDDTVDDNDDDNDDRDRDNGDDAVAMDGGSPERRNNGRGGLDSTLGIGNGDAITVDITAEVMPTQMQMAMNNDTAIGATYL